MRSALFHGDDAAVYFVFIEGSREDEMIQIVKFVSRKNMDY